MRTKSFVAYSWLVVVLAFACGDDGAPPLDGGMDDGGADAAGDANVDETCEATLTWYQKDAYKETPGRTSAFWPPHTTMGLTVTCTSPGGAPELVASLSRDNHGTSPSDLDVTGVMILDVIRLETATGSRAQMEALASAFEACECGTTFLSMDALSDSVVEDLVAELAAYMTANLTCTGEGGTSAIVDALAAGDVDEVLVLGAECSWSAGRSWEEGFDDALTAVIATSSEVLADYHVCNNDASLQAALFQEFATTGDATNCDAAAPICSSPLWFYAP